MDRGSPAARIERIKTEFGTDVVIEPIGVIDKYGTDATRFTLAASVLSVATLSPHEMCEELSLQM